MVKRKATTKRFIKTINEKCMSKAIEEDIEFLEEQIAKEREVFKGYEPLSSIASLNKTIEGLNAYKEPQTSCSGCVYEDSEIDEEERKLHCFTCLEPITLRKNYTASIPTS